MRKGINQIDFAVAAAILLTVFAFVVWHVSSYYSAPMQASESAELSYKARRLWDTAFNQEGVPGDWNYRETTERAGMGSRIWKVPVYINEYNSSGGVYILKVPVRTGERYGRNNAWEGSIIAYQDGEALPTDIEKNGDEGFLDEFSVLFEVDIEDDEETTVDVYYSQDNTTSVNHTDLVESTNATVNTTVFSEENRRSLSRHKAELMERMQLENIRESYGIKHGFRMQFSTSNESYVIGESIPEDTDVEKYSQALLYQNKNGYIEIINPEVAVW
ncbi:MAG: hypothetical protein ACLFQ8_01615 [Candidatus Aenigmatarchaeota archaeon]